MTNKVMAATNQTLVPIFMYGIFRADEFGIRNAESRGWQHVGPRRIDGYTIFTNYGGGTAFARPKEGAYIEGTLWMVPLGQVVDYTDRVERHPHWYKRTAAVTTEGEQCELYVMQEPVENRGTHDCIDIGPQWTNEAMRVATDAHRKAREDAPTV